MYRLMVVARAVDERMWILNRAGKIPFVISGQGHEGAQVAVTYGLRKAHDWMVPYYRSVASLITFGMTPREIMLAQFAKGNDPSSGGRQMPGHYGMPERQILSLSSPVATQLLHATGIALAAKIRKTDQVAMTYLGEGSSNQGDFHEGLNFAGIHRLPVVYVVENNGYAISVPMALQSAVEDIAMRAAGYNMPGVVVDGSDVLACYRAGRDAIDRARAGEGPTLIEAKVTRLTAHSSDDQHTKYRTAEEIESEKGRDALPLFRDQLRSAGLLDEESEAAILEESRKVVEDSTDWAEAQPEPDPATAQRWVYADAPPARMDDELWTGARFAGDGGPFGTLAAEED
ncbi:MAG TPA: thiamine pyrophosphate-dependent dehydrogenase E1 component subunit alpha [Candidatus Limnocylindria bacterium]|nr:thiamine pyrophosphate-dependent dehydrogenase E1 component subunit alpha [Candidatus Limnocylindria bacterium]